MVWDRDRFELLWGWVYRFEAYTPARKRRLGYYAFPLLWRDRVFKRKLAAEIERVRGFLDLRPALVP